MVIMETSHGDIEIELLHEEAPISAENFLKYVDAGFYDRGADEDVVTLVIKIGHYLLEFTLGHLAVSDADASLGINLL